MDSGGNLYAADYSVVRVLYYRAGSTTATAVYGGSGFCRTSATDFCVTPGITVDSRGNLYVADSNHNRVLKFNSAFPVANPLDGTWTQVGNMSYVTNAMFAGDCNLSATCSFNNGIDSWKLFTAPDRILFTTGDGLYWGMAKFSDVSTIVAAAGNDTTCPHRVFSVHS